MKRRWDIHQNQHNHNKEICVRQIEDSSDTDGSEETFSEYTDITGKGLTSQIAEINKDGTIEITSRNPGQTQTKDAQNRCGAKPNDIANGQ